MRVPDFARLGRWTRSLAVFIGGMVFGAALFMSMYQSNFNSLLLEKRALQSKLIELLDQNEKLTKYKNSHHIIKTIVLHFENGKEEALLDEVSRGEIKARIQKILQVFVGRPASTFQEPNLLKEVFGRKVVPTTNEKQYTVEIGSVYLIQSTLDIWLRVKPYRPPT